MVTGTGSDRGQARIATAAGWSSRWPWRSAGARGGAERAAAPPGTSVIVLIGDAWARPAAATQLARYGLVDPTQPMDALPVPRAR